MADPYTAASIYKAIRKVAVHLQSYARAARNAGREESATALEASGFAMLLGHDFRAETLALMDSIEERDDDWKSPAAIGWDRFYDKEHKIVEEFYTGLLNMKNKTPPDEA